MWSFWNPDELQQTWPGASEFCLGLLLSLSLSDGSFIPTCLDSSRHIVSNIPFASPSQLLYVLSLSLSLVLSFSRVMPFSVLGSQVLVRQIKRWVWAHHRLNLIIASPSLPRHFQTTLRVYCLWNWVFFWLMKLAANWRNGRGSEGSGKHAPEESRDG